MQKRASSFKGDRPPCPVDPHHTIHRHGHYQRYANCNDNEEEDIGRFLCLPCGHTISVLPDHRLPYRAVPAALVEQHFDAQVNPSEAKKSPASEKEKGCLKRAWARFKQRVVSLTASLGQMISVLRPNAPQLWKQLRQQSNLPAILRQLAAPFNTSLLHDYLCLLPWSTSSS